MPAAPLVVALLVAATSIVGAAVLAADPHPFGPGAALLFSGGMVIAAVIAVAGILLARGRWAGRLGGALAGGWIAAGAGHPGGSGVLLLTLAGIALAANLGPWLGTWIRRRPTTGGVPPAAVALLVTLVLTPAALGAASGDEPVHPAVWALAVWSLLAALLVARVTPGARVISRWLHPIACLATAIATGGLVAGVATGSGAIVAGLAWRRQLGHALAPVPAAAGAVHRLPPELTPPEVLEAAGVDDSGRLRERS
jgi:hypothetical protein